MLEQSIEESLKFLNSPEFDRIPFAKALIKVFETDEMISVYENNPVANQQLFKQFQLFVENLCERKFMKAKNLQLSSFHLKKFTEIGKKYKIGELITTDEKQSLRSPHSKHESSSKFKKITPIKEEKVQAVHSDQSTKKSEEINLSMIELQQQIKNSYQDHKIDRAYYLALEYKKKYPKSTSPQFQKFLERIEYQYETMDGFYSELISDDWIFDKEQDGVSLQYKLYPQQKRIAIRITSELDIPIDQFMSIVTQIDLMKDWVPFADETMIAKQISRNQKIGWSKASIPLLSDREVYYYAAGCDRIETKGSVFFYSKTINKDKFYQQKYDYPVPKQSKHVRLQYKFFVLEYIPISLTRAKIVIASCVDMKLNFLPMFILGTSARYFAFSYFKNLMKVNKNFKGSAWQEKIKAKPHVYEFFKKKIEQYFEGEK